MTIIASAPPTRVEPHVDSAHSFLVTRRDRGTGRYERLGVLTQVQDGWDFRYFREVAELSAVGAVAGEVGLLLVAEPDNPVDPEALLVTTVGGTALGWVPAPLLPLLDLGTDVRASVAHVNGSDSPPHQRLLVELRGDHLRPGALACPAWRL